jgi:hypothetical protein
VKFCRRSSGDSARFLLWPSHHTPVVGRCLRRRQRNDRRGSHWIATAWQAEPAPPRRVAAGVTGGSPSGRRRRPTGQAVREGAPASECAGEASAAPCRAGRRGRSRCLHDAEGRAGQPGQEQRDAGERHARH